MFLLITYKRQAGGTIDEEVSVAKRVRPIDIQMCNVILDYKQRRVEKCLIEGRRVDTDFDKLHEYYKKIYPNYISQLEVYAAQPDPTGPAAD
jgi:hypothetical protein